VTGEHHSEDVEEDPAGRRSSEDPTAVEGPLSDDETSPEGISDDAETTGVEEAVDAGPSERADVGARATSGAPEPDPPPQLSMIHGPPAQLPWRIARVAAAFVLAGAAFAVHMALNVPDEPVVANPRDQGAVARNKRAHRRGRPERMPERSHEELEEAWSRWSEMPFDDEPMRGRWSRDMQTMVSKAVVVARKAAFEGAPEEPRVMVTGTQCRTIRCRFVLRSPYEHEVDLLGKALARVTYDGEPMWRAVEVEAIDPPTPQSPKDDHYRQVVVGVNVDGYEPGSIDIAPAEDND
jgi:hypothetical protein